MWFRVGVGGNDADVVGWLCRGLICVVAGYGIEFIVGRADEVGNFFVVVVVRVDWVREATMRGGGRVWMCEVVVQGVECLWRGGSSVSVGYVACIVAERSAGEAVLNTSGSLGVCLGIGSPAVFEAELDAGVCINDIVLGGGKGVC